MRRSRNCTPEPSCPRAVGSSETGAAMRAYPPDVVRRLAALVAEAAPGLAAAELLAVVREEAATAERRRVAREIHDGVAQDLASLGYALDGIIAEADAGAASVPAALHALREDVSGVVRSVREAIHTFRSSVGEHDSLGAAISAFAHRVAEQAPFALHVSLQESGTRLPPDAEAQLFRIAQEAIRNASAHANAANLWVTCRVDPPTALLRVEDDGDGIGHRIGHGIGHGIPANPGRSDSYGFVTMAERAQRLGASLGVRERQPTGTCVEVQVGSSGGRVGDRR